MKHEHGHEQKEGRSEISIILDGMALKTHVCMSANLGQQVILMAEISTQLNELTAELTKRVKKATDKLSNDTKEKYQDQIIKLDTLPAYVRMVDETLQEMRKEIVKDATDDDSDDESEEKERCECTNCDCGKE